MGWREEQQREEQYVKKGQSSCKGAGLGKKGEIRRSRASQPAGLVHSSPLSLNDEPQGWELAGPIAQQHALPPRRQPGAPVKLVLHDPVVAAAVAAGSWLAHSIACKELCVLPCMSETTVLLGCKAWRRLVGALLSCFRSIARSAACIPIACQAVQNGHPTTYPPRHLPCLAHPRPLAAQSHLKLLLLALEQLFSPYLQTGTSHRRTWSSMV
jgi:hypothetical protein